MTPARLKEIRKATALSQAGFARTLGHQNAEAYRKYETGLRPIPLLLARLAEMIDRHGLPAEWSTDNSNP